jgi:hypothetical protein
MGSKPCGSSRLEMKAIAPASMAAARSACESLTDMITTGQVGLRWRSSRVASMPLPPGSSRFMSTRSSRACAAWASASSTLRASRNSRGGSELSSQSRSAARISSCASTTRILEGIGAS